MKPLLWTLAALTLLVAALIAVELWRECLYPWRWACLWAVGR